MGGDFTTSSRAAMWSGTAASYVDLQPPGAINSNAYAADGEFQWGGVLFQSGGRAVRWSGSAASMVDFTPPGAQVAGIQVLAGVSRWAARA
jgi:hypothetical protein